MIARRRILGALAGLPLGLSGCGGWEPLYADRATGAVDAELRAIRVSPIGERVGQRLEMALRQSLNPDHLPTPTRYVLQVALQTTRQSLGIQSQGLGTRGEVEAIATFTLTNETGARLIRNTVHVSDSFDIQANGYSTIVAEDDAKVRTVEQLRREIVTRLTLYLQRRAAEGNG